jgi:hypothetical protein
MYILKFLWAPRNPSKDNKVSSGRGCLSPLCTPCSASELNDMTHGVGTVYYYIYSSGKMFSKTKIRWFVNMAWHMNKIFCHVNVFNIVLSLIVMF